MKITLNIDSPYVEAHDFGFMKSSLIIASFISGVSYWIVTAIVLLDSSYQ